MPDDHDSWRRRLHGDWLPVDPAAPEPGTWRLRCGDESWAPVQIWRALVDGVLAPFATLRGMPIAPRAVWPKCAENPVSAIAFKRASEGQPWPDEVAPETTKAEVNADHAAVLAAIIKLEAEAIAWFESIGNEISNQDHADKAKDYAGRFASWGGHAHTCWGTVRRPHRQALDKLERQWQPAMRKAEDCKLVIRQEWLRPWLIKQRTEQTRTIIAAARDPEKIVAARKTMWDKPPPQVIVRAEVTDLRALLRWLVEFEELSPHLESAARKIANQLVSARVENIPGVEVKEEVSVG